MLAAISLCLTLLPQANSWVALTPPGADEGAMAQVLSPSGDQLFVSHGESGTVSKIDTVTGHVVASVPLGLTSTYPSIGDMEWIPGSSEFVVLDYETRQVIRIDGSSMSVLGTALVSVQEPGFMDVNPQGTLAIVSSLGSGSGSPTEEVSVLNLGTMLEERLIEFPSINRAISALGQAHYFTSNGTTVIGAGEPGIFLGDPATIQARDAQTGHLIGEHRFGADLSSIAEFAISNDRTTVYATATAAPFLPPVTPETVRLSAADAGLLNHIQFTGLAPNRVKLGQNGMRAWGVGSGFGPAVSFPTDLSVVGPSTPGFITYPVDNAAVHQVIQGGDRVLIQNHRGELKLCSGAGTLLETIKAPIVPNALEFAENNGVAPVLAAWLVGSDDRVAILNLGSSGGAPRFRSVNTGVGQEFDGPFAFDIDALSDRAVVIASGSDNVAIVDLATRRVAAVVATAAKPGSLEITPDGRALVGHQDGMIVTIDPAMAAELERFQLHGDVVMIAADPAGTQAWVRVDATPNAPLGCALLRVETAGATAGEVARIALPGPSRSSLINGGTYGEFALSATPDARSVAIDYAQGLAYVAIPGLQQIDVVDLQARTILRSYSAPLQRDRSDLELSPDGRRLLVATDTGVQLFRVDPATLTLLVASSTTGGGVSPPSFAFSTNGSTALLNTNDRGSAFGTSAGLAAFDALGAAGRNVTLDAAPGVGFALDQDTIAYVRFGMFLTTDWSSGPAGPGFSAPEFLTRVTDPLTAPRLNVDRKFAAIMSLGTVAGHAAPGLTVVDLGP